MALYGYDISKWQSVGAGDSAQNFLIVKATEGAAYVDPSCDKH
jgi:GH25 family lysozyme M1 (1,4-beta-N-acetylmuramidase)